MRISARRSLDSASFHVRQHCSIAARPLGRPVSLQGTVALFDLNLADRVTSAAMACMGCRYRTALGLWAGIANSSGTDFSFSRAGLKAYNILSHLSRRRHVVRLGWVCVTHTLCLTARSARRRPCSESAT
jgi:hypothetical protein